MMCPPTEYHSAIQRKETVTQGGAWKSANHKGMVRSVLPHSAQAEIESRIQTSHQRGLLPVVLCRRGAKSNSQHRKAGVGPDLRLIEMQLALCCVPLGW